MTTSHIINDTSSLFTPALVFYRDRIRNNIQRCLEMAGNAERLRPHCKTHKTREITKMLLDAGIRKHKCATLAEAEMLASCGVKDVLLAYSVVGPNCQRLANLMGKYLDCWFSVLVDHPLAATELSKVMNEAGRIAGVFLDIDMGQHRTGIAPGKHAIELYEQIAHSTGLVPRGLHLYDGHNHQSHPGEREYAVRQQLEPVLAMRVELEKKGLPVPEIVAGGTPTFPIWAKMELPGLECSPGTCLLHDHGYGSRFPDLVGFQHAALLLTRVISRPTPTRVTFDLGYKAVASDPPAGKRLILLDLDDYEAVLQNEEHLVIETKDAERFLPGDVTYAVPTHICPTCAMHQMAYVVENGEVVDRWQIVGRDRVLTV